MSTADGADERSSPEGSRPADGTGPRPGGLRAFLHSSRIAVSSLGAYRLRSGLTALGVTIGVMTVIAILSIIEGLDNSFEDVVSTMGTGTVYVSNRPLIILNDWWKYKNRPPLVPSDSDYLDERLTLAQTIVPFVNYRVKVDTGQDALDEIRVIGTTADWPIMSGVHPKDGRFLAPSEITNARPVVAVGNEVAMAMQRAGLGVGDSIDIGGFPMRVVGTLPGRGRIFGRTQDDFVVIPLPLFERLYGLKRSIQIGVVTDPANLPPLMAELTGAMRARRKLGPTEEDNFSLNQQDMLVDLYKTLTGSLYATAIGLGFITLVVAGVGIMNIMLVAVAERTREIGIRKALGARPSAILTQFVVESALVSGLGGAIGTGLGALLAQLVASATPLPAAVPTSAIVIGVGFGAFVGVVFGFLPAYRASRLLPVDALSHGG